MYAVELETNVKDRFIEIPEFEKFKSRHIKVIFMTEINDNKEISDKKSWDSFIENTAGILKDDPISRFDNSSYETRLELM